MRAAAKLHAVDPRSSHQFEEEIAAALSENRLLIIKMRFSVRTAPIHTSDEFMARLKEWEEKGLYVYLLPAYSPELNLIEILWRKIKYEWLPLNAYLSFDSLKKALAMVLKQIGSKYQITFE